MPRPQTNPATEHLPYDKLPAHVLAKLPPHLQPPGPPEPPVHVPALYFQGRTPETDIELFRLAPGSSTPQAIEIFPGAQPSTPTELTVVGDDLYFAAYNPATGRELYRLESGSATPELIDLAPGLTGPAGAQYPQSSVPQNLFAWGDVLYFSAEGLGPERQLYRLNPGGDTPIPIDVQVGGLEAPDYTVFDGALYFQGRTPETDIELFRLAPGSSTPQAIEIFPGNQPSRPTELTVVGDDLYFAAYNPATGRELYRLEKGDATPEPIDLAPGMTGPAGAQYPQSSVPQNLFAWGDVLYFSAEGLGPERQLYRLDPGGDTPIPIDVQVGGLEDPDYTVFDGALYFQGRTPETDIELFRLAPGSSTPQAIEIFPGAQPSTPTELTVVGDDLYFAAYNPASGRELYRLESGSATPELLDLAPGLTGPAGAQYPQSSVPQNLFAWGDVLYFSAEGPAPERQLYRLDSGSDTPIPIDVQVGGLQVPDYTLF